MRYYRTWQPVTFGGTRMPKGHYAPGQAVGSGGVSHWEVSVPLPAPGRRTPKPGHWRTSPLARVRMRPRANATPFMPANMHGVGTVLRSKQRLPRKAIRLLIAAGALPPSAMPKRGKRGGRR